MKPILRNVLVALCIAAVSAGAMWAYTGGPKSYRIRNEFEQQMLDRLPKTHQMMGGTYAPVSVKVTEMTEGPKGYSIQYRIDYSPSASMLTGVQLSDDGFGRYCCNLDTLDGNMIQISIPG
jgi:hypothetical protein